MTIKALRRSKLSGANLGGIEWRAGIIDGNDFGNANLHGARIWANGIDNNKFVGTDMGEAYLGTSSGHGRYWSFSQNIVREANLVKARIETDLCYHSQFEGSDLSGFSMVAYDVIRFCTVTDSKADGSYWTGQFINQVFTRTSLVDARFGQEPQSNIDFIDSDLRNAVLSAGGQAFNSFAGSILSGANIRGVICAEGSIGVCE
jgi:uncharacterized protein YjbI with pentapeptide repeats